MRRKTMAAAAILGLVAAGCGGSDDLLDRAVQEIERLDDAEPESDDTDPATTDEPGSVATEPDDAEDESGGAAADRQPDPGDAAGEIDPADFPTIAERTIDVAVQYGVIEWEIQEMIVVDLDADLQPGEQPQGVEITFPTRVFNAGGGTASVNNTPIALQWDDPQTGDTFTVSAQADFRDVPADSFTSGELRVHLTHDDRSVFDDDTAYLLVGRPGVTPAVVPIGAAVEPVTRLVVPQEPDDWTFDIEGVDTARRTIADTITVTGAEVRWSGPEGQPLEDGNTLLQIAYTIENRGEGQTCSQRSEGGWRLTMPDGDAVNDLRVSERCAGAGETVTGVLTGFIIPTEDYAGDYVLTHSRGAGATNPEGEVEITIVEADGVRLSERD